MLQQILVQLSLSVLCDKLLIHWNDTTYINKGCNTNSNAGKDEDHNGNSDGYIKYI